MGTKSLSAILIVFAVLLISCEIHEIGTTSMNFTMKTTPEKAEIGVGKAIRLEIKIEDLDPNNFEPLKTQITNLSSSSKAIIKIDNEEINNKDINHNYHKEKSLFIDFTAKQSEVYKLLITVSNDYASRNAEITIDCTNSYFNVSIDNLPVDPLIDKKYDFDLLITEQEKSESIQSSARIIKGSGLLYLSDKEINETENFHLSKGKNTISYISQKEGENVIQFSIYNEFGYNSIVEIPLKIKLPEWYLSSNAKDSLIIPHKENYSCKFDVIEKDIFNINTFIGIYRVITNSTINLEFNSEKILQGKDFTIKNGANVLIVNSESKGLNQIELTVKDKYNQEKKDTINLIVKSAIKPIEASVDKLSQKIKVGESADIKLLISELNYDDVFFVTLELINGEGKFKDQKMNLSSGEHYLSFTPSLEGNHTFKINISDKNGQFKDFTCTVQAELPIYTINTTTTIGGSVTGGGKYEHGANVTLVATTKHGYNFIGWFENNIEVSKNATYYFIANKSATYEAKFSAALCEIIVTTQTTEGGSVKGSGTYPFNTNATVTATVAKGYTFRGWYEGTNQVSTEASYTFAVVTTRTLQAKFNPIDYTISVSATTGGIAMGGGNYNFDSNATVVATPENGYSFDGWYEGTNKVSSSNSYTFKISGSRTLQAKFTANNYNITVSSAGNGTVSGGGAYAFNNNATVVATATTGYSFIGWYEGNTSVSLASSYTFKVSGTRTLQARFNPISYPISVSATTGGTATGGGNYNFDNNATVVATSENGYSFDGWYEGTNKVSSANSYTFKISGARTLQAKFTTNNYNITVSSAGNGTVSGEGTYTFNTNATVVATAATGYSFIEWYEGNTSVSSASSYTFKVSRARTLQARFTINSYKIVVNTLTGGSITGGGTFNYNTNVTVTAIPSMGYNFDGWYEGSTKVSSANSYTFTVTGNRTLEARYSLKKFNVVVNATTGGSVTGSGTYPYNTNATMVATAATGYSFMGWYEGTNHVSTSANYTFAVVSERTLQARFNPIGFPISVSATTGGTATGGGNYNFDSNATVVATPENGYSFDGWYEGTNKVSSASSYTFKISGARTLQAKFTANNYNITVSSAGNGTVSGGGAYAFNNNATVLATAANGYSFIGWYEGNTSVSLASSYTFKVSGTRTLQARFNPISYPISVSATTGGTATGGGNYNFDSNATVVATAENGYYFDGWYEGSTKISSANSYTFKISSARTLQAKFTTNSYNITVSSTGNGTVSGGGAYTFNTNATVVATAANGYSFIGWYEGNTSVSLANSYTFKVSNSRTLQAKFTVNSYKIIINTLVEGSVMGGGTFNYNTNVTVTAIPNTGYNFDGWYEGSTKVSSANSYTFTVTGNRTLEARYSLKKFNVVANATTGGSTTGSGIYSYNTNATMIATAATGYSFVGWYDGNTLISYANSYTFKVSGAHTLQAKFKINSYKIIVNTLTGGSVTGGGTFNYSTNVTVTAIPNTGYNFDGWYEGSSKVSSASSYIFTVTGNRNLEARYFAKKFNVMVNATTGGSATGSGTYSYNTDATVVATAAKGYTFAGWYEGANRVSTSANYTFTIIAARTLQAKFNPISYAISVSTTTGGTATGGGNYNFDSNATVVANAAIGYSFEGWYEEANKVFATNSYTFKVSGTRTLQARFTVSKEQANDNSYKSDYLGTFKDTWSYYKYMKLGSTQTIQYYRTATGSYIGMIDYDLVCDAWFIDGKWVYIDGITFSQTNIKTSYDSARKEIVLTAIKTGVYNTLFGIITVVP